MSVILSFPPVASPDALVCILGSMPGKASLTADQYYAHPRNAFWPIIEAVLGVPCSLPYQERIVLLKMCRVALWDVLGSCVRTGSLDSNIDESSIVPNDFNMFFAVHSRIRTLFFNGTKAESVYRRDVLPALSERSRSLRLIRLPSTSPAHAGMAFEKKKEVWRSIEWALAENA